MSYITLSQLKHHLQIDQEWDEDNNYLLHLIDTSENAVSKAINKPLYACVTQEGILPPSITHSILLLAGSLYNQRESIAPIQLHKANHSLDWLLSLDRHYNIPR